MRSTFIISFILFVNALSAQFPVDQLLGSNETPTYEETIDFYSSLAEKHEGIALFNMGDSDYGLPIYLCMLNFKAVDTDSSGIINEAHESTTLLINNAIHPGEPCGVNASMKLALDFAEMNSKERESFPIIGIIPAYNVGGMKNRGAYSRANQKGPELHGFRGNASNLDLNRDFIKMDSKNMFTFATIFQGLDPDVFIDTHTSNGANYQYTLTYITPIMEKLAPGIRTLFEEKMIPFLEHKIENKWGYELFPYVNLKGKTPKEGMVKFNASPRYSMGYADLFHTLSITTETHMLKPFKDRVESTYAFLLETAEFTADYSMMIETARREARAYDQEQKALPANFELDTIPQAILFKGYEWEFVKSEITVGNRLRYNEHEPKEMTIPYFKNYHATDTLPIPNYFIVERQAFEVIDRLRANHVKMTTLDRDSTVYLGGYKVTGFESLENPYEGHFLHTDMSIQNVNDSIQLKKGDVIISTDQNARRFIAKLLNPVYMDSYFAWNFFDSYLQQKEHFSPYVFESIASDLLEKDSALQGLLDQKMKQDPSFAASRYQKLLFIYRNSPHYENHGVLPVYYSLDK